MYSVEFRVLCIRFFGWCCVVWVWCLLGIYVLGGEWWNLKVCSDKLSVCVSVCGCGVYPGLFV